MGIFEQATRMKFRFNTSKGLLSVEDLWDLPLTGNNGRANLDELAQDLDVELRSTLRTSFVTPDISKHNEVTQLKFTIVIHIINVKVAEQKAVQDAAILREKKQKIMAIIEKKQDEALSTASLDELQAMLASL